MAEFDQFKKKLELTRHCAYAHICDRRWRDGIKKALANIAETTPANLDAYFEGAPLENEICYRCLGADSAKDGNCPRRANGRCH